MICFVMGKVDPTIPDARKIGCMGSCASRL